VDKDTTDGVGIIIADSTDRQSVTKVLLMKRGEKTRFPGQWENCGGSVEAGESLEEAAQRELLEELGVRAKEMHRLLAYQPFGVNGKWDHIFLATIEGTPQIQEQDQGKCSEIGWKTLAELAELPLTEYARTDFWRLGWIPQM
jgi:8-oxo-dGTP pyrophosphatase MutT (NUDIX family)